MTTVFRARISVGKIVSAILHHVIKIVQKHLIKNAFSHFDFVKRWTDDKVVTWFFWQDFFWNFGNQVYSCTVDQYCIFFSFFFSKVHSTTIWYFFQDFCEQIFKRRDWLMPCERVVPHTPSQLNYIHARFLRNLFENQFI